MPDTSIRPFEIHASDDELDDLRRRLRATRWPERETVDDWSQGIPLAYVQELCAYWADEVRLAGDREAAQRVPAVPRPSSTASASTSSTCARPNANALPLVITHGWPGSIVEFHKVIGPLTDPAAHGGDAGRRVPRRVPVAARATASATSRRSTGWSVERIADAWAAADGAPRLRPLRRAGRRLGRDASRRASARRTPSTASAST